MTQQPIPPSGQPLPPDIGINMQLGVVLTSQTSLRIVNCGIGIQTAPVDLSQPCEMEVQFATLDVLSASPDTIVQDEVCRACKRRIRTESPPNSPNP